MNGINMRWLKQVGIGIHTALCSGHEQGTLRTGRVSLYSKKCGLMTTNFQCNHKKWFAFFTILIFPKCFLELDVINPQHKLSSCLLAFITLHCTSGFDPLPVSVSKFSVLHELVPFLIILSFLRVFPVGTSDCLTLCYDGCTEARASTKADPFHLLLALASTITILQVLIEVYFLVVNSCKFSS